MGSGIAPDEGPMYLGKCEYCGREIYDSMEHWEIPWVSGDEYYCSTDCLLYALGDYHYVGVEY